MVLFSDDFSGDLSAWTTIAGTWTIASGQLNCASWDTQVVGLITNDGAAWIDYYFQADIVSIGEYGYTRMLARYTDANNLYYINLKTGTPANRIYQMELRVIDGGVDTSLIIDYTVHALPQTVKFQVEDVGADVRIRVWVGAGLEIDYTESPGTQASGKIGFGHYYYTIITDNVVVDSLGGGGAALPQRCVVGVGV